MALSRLRSLGGIPPRLSVAHQRVGRISCASSSNQRCWSSTDSTNAPQNEKPYYITSPIFYVNAAPHIGHLYTMVLADVLKRWQQLKGRPTFLSTGTDEHGMKIQRAALREDMPPKELCDENSKKFHDLANQGGVAYDDFIRTTDERHKDAVGHFYSTMKNGLVGKLGLYKGDHEGWYSVDDECFYPEDLVEPSIVPQTGKKVTVSKETGSAVEWVKEETWFFPLTKYKDQLLRFFDENPEWIEPNFRMKEIRDWVENHLEDLSVTRPVTRLSWGIKDPEDHKQTIYVWVDALINYLTVTGYGKDWHIQPPANNLWPADLHIVGKDIIRFHAVYWPAMLLALDLPLPKKILCHNHWTMSNRKMSKSVGNVVNPIFAIQRWGIDALRYFLMRNGSLVKDMGYSNEIIEMIYQKELQANIGNLFYRTCLPKSKRGWSAGNIVREFRGNFSGYRRLDDELDPKRHFTNLEPFIDACPKDFTKAMEEHNPAKAIDHIFNLMREANRYVSDIEPWKLAKQDDLDSKIMVNWCIYNCTEALRITGILLQPIMPQKATQLLDEMHVDPQRRTLEWAARGRDDAYGPTVDPTAPRKAVRVKSWDTIFPPLPAAEYSDREMNELLAEVVENPTRNKTNKMGEFLALQARLGEEGVKALLEERRERRKERLREKE